MHNITASKARSGVGGCDVVRGKMSRKTLNSLTELTIYCSVIALANLTMFGSLAAAKDGITIGTPYEKNLERHSIADSPDDSTEAKTLRRFKYQISCTHKKGFQAILYMSISPPVPLTKKLAVPDNLSLGVSYFVSNQTDQFIFGSFADINGRSDGRKFYVRSSAWDCKLYDTLNEVIQK
jgi:hypothetical protein